MLRQFVVIKEKLNIRSRPSADSDETFAGTLLKDEVLILDDQEVVGTIPVGAKTNAWLKDTFNRFVSREGVKPHNYDDKKKEFIQDATNSKYFRGDSNIEANWKISWGHVDLEIWKIWRDYNCHGEGIKVVVIDTGVSADDNDLKGRISPSSKSFLNGDIADGSNKQHGTKSAGIIGADGVHAGTVMGVAPACELIVFKAGDQAFKSINIFNAVTEARKLNPHIISMSIQNDTFTVAFQQLINECRNDGIIVLAAAGDRGDGTISYPGAYSGCICIGAYELDNLQQPRLYSMSNRNEHVKILAPGHNILTTSSTATPAQYDATSAATAFAAGMFALVLSCCRTKNGTAHLPTTNDILRVLESGVSTIPINHENGEGFGILQPSSLINHLLNQNSLL